jgi:hypothetical protein
MNLTLTTNAHVFCDPIVTYDKENFGNLYSLGRSHAPIRCSAVIVEGGCLFGCTLCLSCLGPPPFIATYPAITH